MENKHMTEFAERVKSMSVEQLNGYKSAAKNINRALTFLGVSFILLMISYPVIPMLFCGGILVFVFSKASEGVSLSLTLVKEQLAKLEKT
jgi:hypothetical protein